MPFTILCRRLLQETCWPQIWRLHVIRPLYKRGSAFMAGNYRGIHLTAILAKTAERFIARDLIAFLHTGKFGPDQWAFTPELSARDLVTASMMFLVFVDLHWQQNCCISWRYLWGLRSCLQRLPPG